jgi:hypothetical protein
MESSWHTLTSFHIPLHNITVHLTRPTFNSQTNGQAQAARKVQEFTLLQSRTEACSSARVLVKIRSREMKDGVGRCVEAWEIC